MRRPWLGSRFQSVIVVGLLSLCCACLTAWFAVLVLRVSDGFGCAVKKGQLSYMHSRVGF